MVVLENARWTIGAFAGMILGVGTSILLFLLWGAPNIPVAGAIAMIVPMIVTPIVSLLTKPMPKRLLIPPSKIT